VGLGDRLRGWLKGEGKRQAPSPSTSPATKAAMKELEAFIGTRVGAEGYLEPKTAIYSTTLLVVAADGEYLRRPVRSREAAHELCSRVGIPLYDASKVGYPKRMRDFDAGVKRDTVSLEDLPPWPGEDGVDRPGGPAPSGD